MKTQTIGKSLNFKLDEDIYCSHKFVTSLLLQPVLLICMRYQEACNNYKANRINGTVVDSPAYELQYDGFVEFECQSLYRYKIVYAEGPTDKLWMEARDRNYVFRLEREGKLDEVEPNLKAEVPKLYEEVMAYRAKRTVETAEAKIRADAEVKAETFISQLNPKASMLPPPAYETSIQEQGEELIKKAVSTQEFHEKILYHEQVERREWVAMLENERQLNSELFLKIDEQMQKLAEQNQKMQQQLAEQNRQMQQMMQRFISQQQPQASSSPNLHLRRKPQVT